MAELDVDKVGWFSENILNNILKKTYYKEVCRKYNCCKYKDTQIFQIELLQIQRHTVKTKYNCRK